jgi:hypothetical protein
MSFSRTLPVALVVLLLGWSEVNASPWQYRERRPTLQDQAQYFGSEDYFEAHGGTPRDYITALFNDMLQRPPTPVELTHWTARLQTCGNGQVLAREFLIYALSQLSEVADHLPPPVLEPNCQPRFSAPPYPICPGH